MNKYQCQIKNNHLVFDQQLNKPDGDYILTISKPKELRSGQQLKYLWAVVYKTIADETGNDIMDIHLAMKSLFLTENIEIDCQNGKYLLPLVRSISKSGDVSTDEMAKYIDNIVIWASRELGIIIPEVI